VVQAADVLASRYRLVDCLAQGGMAVVWRAVDEVLDRQVAVKVLAAKFAGAPDARARVLAEARAAARLSHPHIGAIHDYGESFTKTGDIVPFVVMELLTGLSLIQRMKQGPVEITSALRICAQVASALAAAHAQGLVHRDVKPGNVMLTRDGAKVVDFGLAAAAGDRDNNRPDGLILGTPEYLAPERLSGATVIAASDVYALGLMLYRLLSGKLPWNVATATQMLKAHTYLEPEPLPQLRGVPPLVVDLIQRCLAKDPWLRPPSKEVAVTLALAAGVRVPSEEAEDDEPDEHSPGIGEGSNSDASRDPGRGTTTGPKRWVAVVGSGLASDRPPRPLTRHDPYVARLTQLDPQLDHIALRRRAGLLLRGAVGFDLAIWCVLDPVTSLWASCLVDGGPYDERLEHELFANEYGQQDVLKLVELADGPRVGTLSATTARHPRTSARFRNILEPRGFTDELRLVLDDGTSAWGALCLYRTDGRFGDQDLAQLAPASRPLATALRRSLVRDQVGRTLAPDNAPAPVTGAPRTDAAVLTIATEGRLVAMSDQAAQLLDPEELTKVVEAAAAGRVCGLVDPPNALSHRDRWLAFHAVERDSTIRITVQRIGPHQVSELLARSLELTRSQWRLLGAVARGRPTHRVARELRMSTYAVQDDLTSLFTAFHVDGRVNLIKALFFEHYLPMHERDLWPSAAPAPTPPESPWYVS
jgi:serine/threonine protein kinase